MYGARPLRRFIQHEVETRIARALLSGEVQEGSTIELVVSDGELQVRWHAPERRGEAPQPAGVAA